jgi:acetylornithine deacetylase/succinyl-diaminopimelate desuccinylase-like protein
MRPRPLAGWLLAALLVLPRPALAAGDPVPIDWDDVAGQAASLLSRYIQIDTTNPPGNETTAARFLARVLEAEGLRVEVDGAEPTRGNVYTRRPGTGDGSAVVLLHHMDVVPAEEAEWTVPPFAGARRGGFLYGRGSLDCKGTGIAQLMALLLLHRRGETLAHDVVFLGTADEETGGSLGAGWVVRERRRWLDGAAMLLNEGGHIHAAEGPPVFHVSVAEKAPCWLRLRARGAGGHGSTPPGETAVTRLLAALERVRTHRTPVRVVPAVAEYFAAIAPSRREPERSRFLDLDAALADPAFRREFESDPYHHALVHNTITPTVLVGAQKTNVIPAVATADLDCRLLPGEDPDEFVATIRALIDDPDVEIERLLSFAASSSASSGPLIEAIRRVADRELPGSILVPSVTAGFTDSHYFRDLGIPSYGFVPFAQPPEERLRIHGVDERLSVEVLGRAIRFFYELLRELG